MDDLRRGEGTAQDQAPGGRNGPLQQSVRDTAGPCRLNAAWGYGFQSLPARHYSQIRCAADAPPDFAKLDIEAGGGHASLLSRYYYARVLVSARPMKMPWSSRRRPGRILAPCNRGLRRAIRRPFHANERGPAPGGFGLTLAHGDSPRAVWPRDRIPLGAVCGPSVPIIARVCS